MNWDATRLIDVLVVPLLGSVRTKGVQPSRATGVDRSIGADGRNLFLVVTALAQGSRTASGEFPFLCACGLQTKQTQRNGRTSGTIPEGLRTQQSAQARRQDCNSGSCLMLAWVLCLNRDQRSCLAVSVSVVISVSCSIRGGGRIWLRAEERASCQDAVYRDDKVAGSLRFHDVTVSAGGAHFHNAALGFPSATQNGKFKLYHYPDSWPSAPLRPPDCNMWPSL